MMKPIYFLLIFLMICSVSWAGIDIETDDFIQIGSTSVPTNGGLSVFAVFSIDTLTAGANLSVVARSDSDANPHDWDLSFIDADNTLIFRKRESEAGDDSRFFVATAAIEAGTIYRVSASSDSGSSALRVNINGTVTSGSTLSFNGAGGGSTVCIGVRCGATGKVGYWNGKIYHVCIWNEDIPDAAMDSMVASHTKNTCENVYPTNLVAEFYLDDAADGTSGDGVTFLDRSGTGNSGTGDNGANNTEFTMIAERTLTYP